MSDEAKRAFRLAADERGYVTYNKALELVRTFSQEDPTNPQKPFAKELRLAVIEALDLEDDDEMNRILVRLNSELERQKKKLNDYLSEQNTTLDALKAKWRPQAEKNVKISLILDEIGKSEKVQVLPEEVGQALKGVSETNLSEEQRKDLERYLAFSIFQAKTLDLVKKTVTS